MTQFWLSLHDIPAQGREFSFTDHKLWTEPIKEFDLAYSINSIQASLFIQPQKDGCLVWGHLQADIEIPCDRCTRNSNFSFDEKFEIYEELASEADEPALQPNLLRLNNNVLELDVAGVLWEQFVLLIPPKPLCTDQCAGICSKCGKNLNVEKCNCAQEEGDPRLEIFRKLSIE
jgi:uncharacterized protein